MSNKVKVDKALEFSGGGHEANVYGPMQEKKVHLHDHFTGLLIDATNDYTVTVEGDNDIIAVSSSDSGGWASFLSGDTDNEACGMATRLTWRAYENCACEARFKLADVLHTAVFFGFSDAVTEAQVLPIDYLDGTLTPTADDAIGIVFDTDAAAAYIYAVSDIAGGGTGQSVDMGANTTVANDTWVVARVETSTDADGHVNATFYVTIGTETTTAHIFSAITATDYLCMFFGTATRENGLGDYTYLDRWDAWQDEVA